VEDRSFEGIEAGRDEVVVGAGWALSAGQGVQDNMSPRRSCGCNHWAHSRTADGACHWGPVWTGILLSSLHFPWEEPRGFLFPVVDQGHGEGGADETVCA
jgi:hypothetical protein